MSTSTYHATDVRYLVHAIISTMSKTLQSSLITEPHLLDVVDDEWMQDVLANDCEALL